MGKMRARPYTGPNVIDVFARHPGWRVRLVAVLTHDEEGLAASLAGIKAEVARELAEDQARLREGRRLAKNARRRLTRPSQAKGV